MKNPWKLKPLLICATPVVSGLLQVTVLGYSTGRSDNIRRTMILDAITLLALLFPLISLPALSAAIAGLKMKAARGWYLTGAVLNATYCFFLSVPILTLVTIAIHSGKR